MGLKSFYLWFTLLVIILHYSFYVSAEAKSAKLRLDLYQKITKETGISLKEVFQLLEGKDNSAANNLKIYVKQKGTKELEKFIKDEIFHRKAYCKKKNSNACFESIEEIQDQLNSLTDLAKNLDKQNGFKKLYFFLVIYNFNIKNNVLKSEYVNWDKACNSQEKINTIVCQEKLYGFHVLVDISTDLAQFAFQKSEKSPEDTKLISSLQERISKYEK